jgi:hypothetical protein
MLEDERDSCAERSRLTRRPVVDRRGVGGTAVVHRTPRPRPADLDEVQVELVANVRNDLFISGTDPNRNERLRGDRRGNGRSVFVMPELNRSPVS